MSRWGGRPVRDVERTIPHRGARCRAAIARVDRYGDDSSRFAAASPGVAIERYRVLAALNLAEGRTMGDLAAQVFVDLPTLTKIIDRMVANTEVYRAPDPADRRRVLIFSAEKGRQTFSKLRDLIQSDENSVTGRLKPQEAHQLRALLITLLNQA